MIGFNSNVSSLNALKNIYQADRGKNSSLEKLSSGLKINKGADNPSGLLISELLRSQIGGFQRALQNTQETSNVMSIAEGGLSGVSSMLSRMRGLAIHALNSGVTSQSQTNADQMEMNSALSTINRVVSTTRYGDKNLLDGTQAFTFQTQDPGAILDAAGSSIASLSGTATNAVDIAYAGGQGVQAERAYLESDFGAATTAAAQEFTVTGALGGKTFSFAAGTSIEDMASQINSMSDSTGVNAYAIRDQGTGATAIRLASTEYGSEASVRVDQRVGDAFARQGGNVTDYGQDAQIEVNGSAVTTQGLTANVANGDVNATIKFQATGANGATSIAQTGYDQDTLVNAAAAQAARMTNIKGGMQLQLGEGAGGQNRELVSLGNYNPAVLGQVTVDGQTYSMNDLYGGGAASLANNPELAIKVIDQAISDVASGRANIGAYQANALDTNANNLMVAIENTTASESSIRDTDMAEAMTLFIKNKLLEDAGLKGLQSSNMNASNVARLLGMNW